MKTRTLALLTVLTILLSCLAGCSLVPENPVCQHRDADDNALCDLCQSPFSDGHEANVAPNCRHRDANDDFRCDHCGENFTDGYDRQQDSTCSHRDLNDDLLCDRCGKAYDDGNDQPTANTCRHEDKDNDRLCDLCNEPYHLCVDADDDLLCDVCAKECDDGQDVYDECPHFELSDMISEFKQATCTEDGYNRRYWYCLDCGEKVTGWDYTTPAINHNGTVIGVCTVCGELDPGGQLAEGELFKKVNHEGVNYLFFGEYPQMLKRDDVTITQTQDARGYYLGSDGCYYAKVVSNDEVDEDLRFAFTGTVSASQEYYFKVQPLRWRILSEKNGVASIVCDSILDYMPFQPEYTIDGFDWYVEDTEDCRANSYAYSYIRKWLCNTFYNIAFTAAEQGLILPTTVINRKSEYDHESYQNTLDKIFVLDSETIDQIRQDNLVLQQTDFCLAKTGERDANLWSRESSPYGDRGSEIWIYHADSVQVNSQSVRIDCVFGVIPQMTVNLGSPADIE